LHATSQFTNGSVQKEYQTTTWLNKLQIFKNPCLAQAGSFSFALFFQLQNKMVLNDIYQNIKVHERSSSTMCQISLPKKVVVKEICI